MNPAIWRKLFAGFVLLLGCGIASAPAQAEPSDFDAQTAALREKYDAALARLDANAVAEYESLKARYGESGKLDAAIWAANQIAELKGEPPIPGGDPNAFPKSDPVAENRRAGYDRFGEIYVAEVRRLYEAEVSRLEELTRQLTIAGELEKAEATMNAARRLARKAPTAAPTSARLSRRIPAELAGGAFTFGGRSYYLLPEPMNHAEAKSACAEAGGSILSIGSEEEYNHFHAYSVENGKPLWIDLNDEEEDLDWRHGAGKKARFLKWQSGEPNGGDSQKHVMIGYNGSWDMRDVNPDDRFYVICEW